MSLAYDLWQRYKPGAMTAAQIGKALKPLVHEGHTSHSQLLSVLEIALVHDQHDGWFSPAYFARNWGEYQRRADRAPERGSTTTEQASAKAPADSAQAGLPDYASFASE